MTLMKLEQVIRDYVLDIYHKEYIGKINIEKLQPFGYHIKLGMNTPDQPIVICAYLEDKPFLNFLKDELKTKKFNLRSFGEVKLNYPYICGTPTERLPKSIFIPNNSSENILGIFLEDDGNMLLEDGNYILSE